MVKSSGLFFVKLLIFFICLFSTSGSLFAEKDEPKGSLLVTYQTGPKGERLERVHFRLKGPGAESQLYPKGQTVLSHSPHPTQHVAIENLLPGDYTVEFVVPNQDGLFDPVSAKKITISPGRVSRVDQHIKPRYAALQVNTANTLHHKPFTELPTISLYDSKGNLRAESTVGRLIVHYLVPGQYTLVYSHIVGLKTPKPQEILVHAHENIGPITTIYEEENKEDALFGQDLVTALVPKGPVLLGDIQDKDTANTEPSKKVNLEEFRIGLYEVTNEQYASWLSLAYSEEKIYYSPNDFHQGEVLDREGHLLFKTFKADSKSQIVYESGVGFSPLIGKEKHPVIFVSWYGAVAFCKDQNARLPNEAEWEKAAGMAPYKEGEPLKKYRYGFSSNTLTAADANYRATKEGEALGPQVYTEVVGYYNGKNPVPSRYLRGNPDWKTNLSLSPYGAFDMSGNVWEWTDEESLTPFNLPGKIVKGGCYDSTQDGVRVSERLALPLDHVDQYTGFRIAR